MSIKVYVDDACKKTIKYGTPTIYNPAIKKIIGEPKPGDVVEVYSLDDVFLGKGIWQAGYGIRVRLFTRRPDEEINLELIEKRIKKANEFRKSLGFKDLYRMVYGDSDLLPSLIVDRYKELVVVQNSDPFLDKNIKEIAKMIYDLDDEIKCVYEKDDTRARQKSTLPTREEKLYGEDVFTTVVKEHGIKYYVDVRGQKTGFYLDQRDNRFKLRKYIEDGDKVLDLFCYTGGFGLNALVAGAEFVEFVDISEFPLKFCEKNLELNEFKGQGKTIQSNAIDYLKKCIDQGKKFDVVILDPPAFIPSKKDKQKGMKAYFIVNKLAYKVAKRVVVTCSCSQFLSLNELISITRATMIENRVNFRISEIGIQSPDHPILPGSPTTWYLKVLFTEIF